MPRRIDTAVRDEIKVLRRERLAYEQESMETRQALTRFEAYCRALEARVTVLETEALEVEDTWLAVPSSLVMIVVLCSITTALAACDATRNGDDSHTSGMGARRPMQVAHECTYPDFLKCQPLNFKGTKGVVRLTQWFEKIESVYSISNCTVACRSNLLRVPARKCLLTCGTPVKPTTPESCHTMHGRTLKKIMTRPNRPRGEIKKLEFEMCNLKVKESDKVEKYVGGLPDMIHGSVMATKPKTMQDAIEFATELMDKKFSTFAEKKKLRTRGNLITTTKLNNNFPRGRM
ncbi:hypothetical protein Tco_0729843 [Tanacetum coccineum]|uniref:Reverse transcriptase domain-containing protein n=1 Tax=Tanacetum coccineum TaxID=301880 RepID=A0ABQ4YSU2_9ASTR